MGYSEAILRRFMQPQFAGQVVNTNAHTVFKAQVGAKEQGAVVHLEVQISTSTQLITDARFKVYGCGACIATADILCEQLIALSLEQVKALDLQQLGLMLTLPPVKMHCIWLMAEVVGKITESWQHANSMD